MLFGGAFEDSGMPLALSQEQRSRMDQAVEGTMKKPLHTLSGVSETLLLPLYWRAIESERPDSILRDEKAVELVRRLDCDFSIPQKMSNEAVAALVRARIVDRAAQSYLAEHPNGTIVEIGCGLDTRYYRIDCGEAAWYELDLPAVIEMRRRLLGEAPRTRLIASSVLDYGWMNEIENRSTCLFLAEGVFPYFEEAQVRQLVQELRRRFRGSELVFDALASVMIGIHNVELAAAGVSARLRWGIKRAHEIERWGPGIRLLDEWFYFDQPEARRRGMGWMQHVPVFSKSASILHYRLGCCDNR